MAVEKTCVVSGTVTDSAGDPVRGARVVVWWQHLRRRTEVASGHTDEHGHYRLEVRLPLRAGPPVLVVVTAESEHVPSVLTSAWTPASTAMTVDLGVVTSRSQWESLVHQLEPLLDGVHIADLTESAERTDLSFLAQELSTSSETLMQVTLAARLARAFGVEAPVFFAFLAQRIPSTLPYPLLQAADDFSAIGALVANAGSLILGLSPEAQTAALTSAVALDVIPPELTARIPELVAALQSRRGANLLSRPFGAGTSTLDQLLELVDLPSAQRHAFAQALATNTQAFATFWSNLPRARLSADQVASVQRILGLDALVGANPALLKLLAGRFASGTFKSIADLAALTLADWEKLEADAVPRERSSPKATVAANAYAAVTAAFPTRALVSRIPGSTITSAALQKPLTTFFTNNADLDLVSSNIAVYLAGRGSAAYAGIEPAQQAATLEAARSIQRVLRIAPTVDVAQAVLSLGYGSATAIANVGLRQFVTKATSSGVSDADARATFAAASQNYATVVAYYTRANYGALGVMPKAIGATPAIEDVQALVAQDASLASLFGSQDYCTTDDCTSVLSPAAYLCDLLLWLQNHPQAGVNAAGTPRTAFTFLTDTRRPDIGNLLLNCPNTDTELPFIDLVIELLADAVSPPGTPGTPQNPQWKQTSQDATAASLSAAPEYFNAGAFETLSNASYPQTLPCSTGLDTLRTYLQQWGLPLWQLRQALLPLSAPTTAQQAAVAAERLGMNTQAQNLTTTPDFVPTAVAWNVPASASPGVSLASVDVFLQASHLTYEQLLELLEVSWVQGGLGVAISGLSDTCDSAMMTLTPSPLDAAFLDRAHRFLRLWLATGYKMWELDMLLQSSSVGAGTLDAKALVNLQAFWQLQGATKLGAIQLLAFFDDIDVNAHRDPDGTTTTPLYAQIFLDPTVTWAAPDADMVLIGNAQPPADLVLADHAKAIQPALAVSAADLTTLASLTDGTLTLANLSVMYRVSTLASVVKLSISDLLTMAALLTPTSSVAVAAQALFASPSVTLGVLSQIAAIRSPAFDLDALTYLLTPPTTLASPGTTTLAAAIGASDTTLLVTLAAGFPTPPFYVEIASEIVEVLGTSGAANLTWQVQRGAQGTSGASASAGATVTQVGDGGWSTVTQMTPDTIAAALADVQGAVVPLLSAATTLSAGIGTTDPSITVASATGFPGVPFYVYIGTEILEVTSIGGTNNATWQVLRGQQGTTPASALLGAPVTPTGSDFDAAVIACVASNAHGPAAAGLASDVTALLLGVPLPGTPGATLLSVLEDPRLVAATGELTLGGSATVGDTITLVLTTAAGMGVTVAYVMTASDVADLNVAAGNVAQAVTSSGAVTGTGAFLASCSALGSTIVLTGSTPFAPGAGISVQATVTTAATPPPTGGLTITPAATALDGVPEPNQALFPAQFLALQLFDKMAVVTRGLKLVASDLGWLLSNAALYGGLDLTQLPALTTQPPIPIASLLTTLDLVKLARAFTSAPPSAPWQTLYDVIGAAGTTLTSEGQAQVALATVTGWPLADIQAFAPSLRLVFPASYQVPATFDALWALEAISIAVAGSGPVIAPASTTLTGPLNPGDASVTIMSPIGFPSPNFYISIGTEILLVTGFTNAGETTWAVQRAQLGTTAPTVQVPPGTPVSLTYGAQIVSWGSLPPDEAGAQALAASALGALKGQQPTQDAWLALAPTLMNPIRERRSQALQAYLTAQRDTTGALLYPDYDSLFDYFLIDVQMSSCQVTSRVVQAYIAVQTFAERCLMNLEAPTATAPGVVVDLTTDDTWSQWEWMSSYRVWEANREVFLYPENWLVESQRPNQTELFEKFTSDVRQGQSTADFLETTVLSYIDGLDGIAHLFITGMCQEPGTQNLHVIARTKVDPPVYYSRSYTLGAWSGWSQIRVDIHAHHAIPYFYHGHLYVFWIDIRTHAEPAQHLPASDPSKTAPSQNTDSYVSIGLSFTGYRNGGWLPIQAAKGRWFDKPIYDSTTQATDSRAIEALYSLKVVTPELAWGLGAPIYVDLFRLGNFDVEIKGTTKKSQMGTATSPPTATPTAKTPLVIYGIDAQTAVQVGRAVFDGKITELQLRNFFVPLIGQASPPWSTTLLLDHAKAAYGPDADPLVPLVAPGPDIGAVDTAPPKNSPSQPAVPLVQKAGAIAAYPPVGATGATAVQILLPTAPGYTPPPDSLITATLPARIVNPVTDIVLNGESSFFFQDNARSYFVEAEYTLHQSGPYPAYYDISILWHYVFHPFYHPFTRLFWNQLSAGSFDLLYDPKLQQTPDNVDLSYPDVFSFALTYAPGDQTTFDLSDVTTTLTSATVSTQRTIDVADDIWVPVPPQFLVDVNGYRAWVDPVGPHPTTTWNIESVPAAAAGTTVTPAPWSQDRQFLDFSAGAPMSIYHWELFYHIPMYVAQLLTQNLQFEDAQTWLRYVFDPTRQDNDPVPGRFWITKPLRNLSVIEDITAILTDVNAKNTNALKTITLWRQNPFDPFLLADLRPVSYMKATVMAYLDNLIAWADNLFSTESREALAEATLLYVVASEILGPAPESIVPPPRADMSFNSLAPDLDAFANAMVAIENVVAGSGGGTIGLAPPNQNIAGAKTFYFRIPGNAKLLGYWTTLADRLYKLRHCQTITGAPLNLALFDAPIDPGLLVAARAAGVDLTSVVSPQGSPIPGYRFTALYPQALDFVNAVRAYGASLQAALEKSDAGTLALLQQTTQQQLLQDGSDVLDWQVQVAQANIDALQDGIALTQQKLDFNSNQEFVNASEAIGISNKTLASTLKLISAASQGVAAGVAVVPTVTFGIAGIGGTPVGTATEGGPNLHAETVSLSKVADLASQACTIASDVATALGGWQRRQDTWHENAKEASLQLQQMQDQMTAMNLQLQINQKNQVVHQEQIANVQKQIDFLNQKFTNDDLYNWMAGSLASTYLKSYQLAYQLCRTLESCYRFELGVASSSFIQFGYWDSLRKGLIAGETLNHDLRRLQAAYLQQNVRRFELSRFVSLGTINPAQLQKLLSTGSCTFDLDESLFDGDYPGHYHRRLTRISVTVVYPNPGKFDNVKATLTLTANKVRTSTDLSSGSYPESAKGSDPRFVYSYAANSQKIALGNGQDDPGLFITAIASNIADTRYVPFENAGAISSWRLDLNQANNEVDVTTIGDVVLHLYYTALDGGADFQNAVVVPTPTGGTKVFSAQNDFPAPPPSNASPYPPSPWQTFLAAGAPQNLVLTIPPGKFPVWTRGKTVTVTSVMVIVLAWEPGDFVLAPQSPLPTTQLTMTPVGAVQQLNMVAATITNPGTIPATWTFQIRQQSASDFHSLTKNLIGDVLLVVTYEVS